MIDLDKLNGADPEMVGQAALRALDGIQQDDPENQILGLGAAFLLACGVHEVKGAKALEVAQNIISWMAQQRGPLMATRLYAQGELKK